MEVHEFHLPKERMVEIPEGYKSFYVEKAGKWVNTEYLEKTPYILFGEAHASVYVPELVVASRVEDIRLTDEARHVRPNYEGYYDDAGMPNITYESFPGLEYYCFFPGNRPMYVFDNHGHALFAWREAKEAGTLEGKVALIRLDAHTDLVPARQSIDIQSRHAVKEALNTNVIDIANFTEPALREGLINDMYFCSGTPLIDVQRAAEDETVRLRNPEMNTVHSYRNHFTDITLSTLQDPQSLERLLQELIDKGHRIILDVDFDMFVDRREDDNTVKQQKIEILKHLSDIAKHAHLITCATSPQYADQKQALAWVKNFVHDVLAMNNHYKP